MRQACPPPREVLQSCSAPIWASCLPWESLGSSYQQTEATSGGVWSWQGQAGANPRLGWQGHEHYCPSPPSPPSQNEGSDPHPPSPDPRDQAQPPPSHLRVQVPALLCRSQKSRPLFLIGSHTAAAQGFRDGAADSPVSDRPVSPHACHPAHFSTLTS